MPKGYSKHNQSRWHHSKETCKEMSKSRQGQHRSPATEFKKGHKINIGRKRTEETKRKMSIAHQSSKNWNWKNGIQKSNGRIFIKKPKHPFCNKAGYVARSRLVMEKIVGRFLKPEEVVHHRNEITDDDKPKNLWLFKNQSAHLKFHLSSHL